MLKTLPSKKPINLFLSSKNSFQDYAGTNKLLNSQSYENIRPSQLLSPKLTLLEINKQKVKNRNSELLKLFKPTVHQNFNIQLLEKSNFMKTNEIFYYLVKCLKKQRQGMINIDAIQQEKAKQPKPIQTKIRQFLYQSLQQSLFMSQKQVQQTKYFERLFQWFTQVFKEREMKLSFKKESPAKNDSQFQDEDWIIRNTYKSNMPLELRHYQRKMLNINQIVEFNEKMNRNNNQSHKIKKQNVEQNKTYELENISSVSYRGGVEKKLFTQTMTNSPTYEKSKQILPILNRKSLLSKLSNFRQSKQSQDLKTFQSEWKKSKAHFVQHLTVDFNKKTKLKQKNLMQRSAHFSKGNDKQKQNKNSFSLGKNVLQKIQAARLGVTFTQFRKNKQHILKEKTNVTYQLPVCHPYLTTNYFYDIKKKRLQKIEKSSFPQNLKYKQRGSKNTEQSQNMSVDQAQYASFKDQYLNDSLNLKQQNHIDELINSIDGLGLSLNPMDKNLVKSKKK